MANLESVCIYIVLYSAAALSNWTDLGWAAVGRTLRIYDTLARRTCSTLVGWDKCFPGVKRPTRRRLDRAEYEEGKESFSIIFADEKCPLSSPQCPRSWGCPIRLTTNQTLGIFSDCPAKDRDRINAGYLAHIWRIKK